MGDDDRLERFHIALPILPEPQLSPDLRRAFDNVQDGIRAFGRQMRAMGGAPRPTRVPQQTLEDEV